MTINILKITEYILCWMTDVYEKVHALRNVIFPLKASEVLHKIKLFPRLIGVVGANVTNIYVSKSMASIL